MAMTLIRRHGTALILAFLIGIICIAPYAYFTFTANYAGIALTGQDAEEHYIARIQEVYDGYPATANVFFSHKDVPYMIPALGEDMVAVAGKISGMTSVDIDTATKFFLPALAFLLLYGLGLSLSRSRSAALLGACLGILASPTLMSAPHELVNLLHGTSSADGFYWARPINPELSGAFLFGILWFMLHVFEMNKDTKYGTLRRFVAPVVVGLLTGMTLYISIYIFLFLGMFLLLLLTQALWYRRFGIAHGIFVAGIVGILSAIPFLINYIHARALPGFAAASIAQGAVPSHVPVLGLWIGVLLLIPLFLWPRHLPEVRSFFILCAVSLLILLNQQLLTGTFLHPTHFHWYITKPLAGLMLGIFAVFLAERFIASYAVRVFLYALVIALCLVQNIFAQIHFYHIHTPDAIAAQAYAPLFTKLNSEPQAQTVFANRTLSLSIPMYTHDDAPNNFYAMFYYLPASYLEKRLLFEYRLRGVTPDQALSTMESERIDISQRLFGTYWREANGSYESLPDSILVSLAQHYQTYARNSISDDMRDLGIQVLVKDNTADTWDLTEAGLTRATTVSDRFELFVPDQK